MMNRRSVLSTLVGALLIFSVLSFMSNVSPARAFSPVFCGAGNSVTEDYGAISKGSTSFTASISTDSCTVGSLFVVAIYIPTNNSANGGSSGASITITGITDNFSDSYVFEGVPMALTMCPGTCGATTYQVPFEVYAANLLGNSSAISFTVHYDTASYSVAGLLNFQFWRGLTTHSSEACSSIFGENSAGALVYSSGILSHGSAYNDVCTVGVATGDVAMQFGSYCGSGVFDSEILQASNGTYASAAYQGIETAPDGCSTNFGSIFIYSLYYNETGFSKNYTDGYYCPSPPSCENNWMGQQTIVFTSVANTASNVQVATNGNCAGACAGTASHNATGYYLTRNELYYYDSRNTQAAGQISNVTLVVDALHMNVTQGYLYVAFYLAAVQPSLSFPWLLQFQIALPLFNNTDGVLGFNPSFNVPAGYYWAVGIMASPEGASRGSGASLSGVEMYLTSDNTEPQMYYAPAVPSASAQTPPATFYASNTQGHAVFFIAKETYTVTSYTVTSVSTLSGVIAGVVTRTTTLGVNSLDLTSVNFWFLPLLFILAPMALLLVVKRYSSGGM